MGRLSGKAALVTGGTSGIGRSTALLFAAEGAQVLLTGRNHDRGHAVASEIIAGGGTGLFVEQDVTVEVQWRSVIESASTHFGRLVIVFNNAGVSLTKPLDEISLADWRSMMAVNGEGTFLGTKYGVQTMRRAGGGSIINNASVYGLIAAPDESAYCAAKAAVIMFSKAVALECARRRDGIRVNCLCAGSTWTPIFVPCRDDTIAPDWSDTYARLRDDMGREVPLGYVAAPEQIAECVLFLASEDSSYMTGSELTVDGGTSAGLRSSATWSPAV